MIWIERGLLALLAVPFVGLIWQASGGVSGVPVGVAWQALRDEPRLIDSLWLSGSVALASVALSLWCARWLCYQALCRGRAQGFPWILMSVPHAALALGVLLLLGASGVMVRWTLPALTAPAVPDYLFPKDSWGLGALAVLVVKESAFLAVLGASLAKQLPVIQSVRLGQEAGLSAWRSWCQLVWPRITRLLMAPILVVFAFSFTNLEVATVLGPDRPAFVSVRLLQWLTDPDPLMRQAGALGSALMLCGLMLMSVGYVLWIRGRPLQHAVASRSVVGAIRVWAWVWPVALALSAGAFFSLGIWSVAGYWPVIAPWPQITGLGWQGLGARQSVWVHTLGLGVWVAATAVALAIGCLEWMARHRIRHLSWVWWAMLWFPALPLAAGLLAIIGWLGMAPGWVAVWIGHVLIAWPYAMVVLADPWLSRSSISAQVIAETGLSPVRALLAVWVPLHSVAIGLALAVAFSVSASLYTQTLLLGGGRVETLMTELVVSLSSERRVAAAAGLANTILPLLIFGAVGGLGRWLWRHRLGMQGGVRA